MEQAREIKFDLSWSAARSLTTTASLTVRVDGEPIWPVAGEEVTDLEVQVDDLLSYLTEFWKPLMLRQTFPISVRAERPSRLRAEAERRWSDELPSAIVEREDALVTAFEETHNLAGSFAGYFGLPSLWLFRVGDNYLIETQNRVFSIAFRIVRAALTAVGNEIADRLEARSGDRWSLLIVSWRNRDQGDRNSLLAWTTSLSPSIAHEFVRQGLLTAPKDVADAANDDNELRIAARMASALAPDDIRHIVEIVKGLPIRSLPDLESMASKVHKKLPHNFSEMWPPAQGQAAANCARDALEIASEHYIDIFEVVERLGVDIQTIRTEPRALDGLAVWGPSHGPAVVLNEIGRHVQGRGPIRSNSGARVTLAHELCHFVLDRGHALSAIDVLGNRMPINVEQRAKAFAGEFLLPSRKAAQVWEEFGASTSRATISKVLSALCERYGVTKSVASWKLEHGVSPQVDIHDLLNILVPQR